MALSRLSSMLARTSLSPLRSYPGTPFASTLSSYLFRPAQIPLLGTTTARSFTVPAAFRPDKSKRGPLQTNPRRKAAKLIAKIKVGDWGGWIGWHLPPSLSRSD